MNNSLPDILTLRNNIEFASISQFFHTFQSAFRPWPVTNHDLVYSRNLDGNEYYFETEDLERMILETSERLRLEDLMVRMLRLCTGKRFINSSSWQTHLSKEFEKKLPEQENPLVKEQEELTEDGSTIIKKEPINYFTLPLETKVHLLHLLCEWQLDEPEKFREHLESEEDAAQWRVDPIGYDKKGSTFWLFDDNRLYKETPKPVATKKSKNIKKKRSIPPSRSSRRSSRRNNNVEENPEDESEAEEEEEWLPWKLVCISKYDWEQFPQKYANSKNIDEQRFYKLLVNDLIPKIIPVLEEHEKEIKKQEAILHRKRSSRILFKELEALERASSFDSESEQTMMEGRSRTSHRIEKKALEKEQQEMENAAKAREARLLERERRIMEREYRAMAREKQQSEEPTTNTTELINNNNALTPETIVKDKPKKKYKKKEKFDANGNPIPKKEKLDENGNPIPKKKRGRKPKQINPDDENWEFDCICGVSGKNLDDGTPMIACEKCSVWQHIACLQKSGQIGRNNSLDDINFICHKCEDLVDVDIVDDEPESKRQKITNQFNTITTDRIDLPLIQSSWQQPSAVRAEPSIMNSKEHTSNMNHLILPNFTNNTTNNNNISNQLTTKEIVPPIFTSTPIVSQTVSNANVGQSNYTADLLPPMVVQSKSIQSPPKSIVEEHIISKQQQNTPVNEVQNFNQHETLPVVTAPSIPGIQKTVSDETNSMTLPPLNIQSELTPQNVTTPPSV